jgi:hypothetical protein
MVAGVRPHAEITEVPRPMLIMSPPLGDVDPVKTEVVRLAAQPQGDICAGLKRREPDADMARLLTRLMLDPLIGSPTECVVLMRVHAILPVRS